MEQATLQNMQVQSRYLWPCMAASEPGHEASGAPTSSSVMMSGHVFVAVATVASEASS